MSVCKIYTQMYEPVDLSQIHVGMSRAVRCGFETLMMLIPIQHSREPNTTSTLRAHSYTTVILCNGGWNSEGRMKHIEEWSVVKKGRGSMADEMFVLAKLF